jgi:hypothetical protein
MVDMKPETAAAQPVVGVRSRVKSTKTSKKAARSAVTSASRSAADALTGRTRKRTVTLTDDLIDEVEDLAGPGNFSAAAQQALAHWAARARLRRAIETFEAKEGEISQAEMDEVVARLGGL